MVSRNRWSAHQQRDGVAAEQPGPRIARNAVLTAVLRRLAVEPTDLSRLRPSRRPVASLAAPGARPVRRRSPRRRLPAAIRAAAPPAPAAPAGWWPSAP